MIYKIAAATHSGIKAENQDNFFCNGIYKRSLAEQLFNAEMEVPGNEHAVYAVMDGVGGLHDGSSAALAVCEALFDTCWIRNADIGTALLEADRSVLKVSRKTGFKMGSTCVIAEERAGRFRSWNVGDSRAYYYSNGRLIQISRDHTEAENARAIQKISGDSFQIPDKYENILTQYLGADKSIYDAEPFVSEWIPVGAGDMILLCSDGLYNPVNNETIIRILETESSVSKRCKELINTAIVNGGRDNITVVLIENGY